MAVSTIDALYNGGSEKVTATSTGISVTGTVTADGLTLGANNANSPQILFENSDGVTGDAAISTYDDSLGTLLVMGANFYINSSGSESRFNTSEESSGVLLNRNGDLSLLTGGTGATATTRLKIDATGNVGIGTSSPSAKLDVAETDSVTYSSSAVQGDLIISRKNSANTVDQVVGLEFDVTGWSGSTTGVAGISAIQTASNASSAALAFQTRNAGTIAERMRIIASGNVGIGTDAPANVLHVHQADATSNSYVHITQADGGSAATDGLSIGIEDGGVNAVIRNRENGYLKMYTNNTERMRLTSGGALALGASNTSIPTNGTAGVTLSPAGDVHCGVATTANTNVMRFDNPNGRVGSISTTNSSTSYGTSSDYRLKTDAQPMTGASARVQALNPVNFEWIADGTRVDGFLAHEAATVVPESVTGTKDAMRDEEYEVTAAVYEDVVIEAVLDDEGTELEAERTEQNLVTEAVMGTRNVPDYQGIDQSKIVPLLTAALQEALTEIAALKARVTTLEG